MLSKSELEAAFKVYFDEMDRCVGVKTYWALLHVVVCMPDICAALEHPRGRATGPAYEAWCNRFLKDNLLSGEDWYGMRCKVLHDGRTTLQRGKRFVFGQPDANGVKDHRREDGNDVYLDVGDLAAAIIRAFEHWSTELASDPNSDAARNVEKNLPSLVRVRQPAPAVQP
jgi:hypothetical protein